MQILVTGATGAVGSEVVAKLEGRCDSDVVGVASSDQPGIVGWRMGAEPVPQQLHRSWDVVVHCAASTRWTMSRSEAEAANIRSTAALEGIVSEDTLLIHLSTVYCVPSIGSSEPTFGPDAFRNMYEWSKYECEQIVDGLAGRTVTVRPPLVIGRRSDGFISRYSGLYTLVRAHVRGQLPAIVGDPDGLIELVTTCDIAGCVSDVIDGDATAASEDCHIMANGPDALCVAEVLHEMWGAVDRWRAARGLGQLEHPPLVSRERWERFYRPFLNENVKSLRVRSLDLLAEFSNYTSFSAPVEGTMSVPPLASAVAANMSAWCDQHPHLASRGPSK